MRSAPAHSDIAWPSPVDSHELEVYDPALADAAGGHHHRLGREHHELTGRAPVANHSRDHAVGVMEEAQHLDLHEDLDIVGDRLLLKRSDQLETGPVTDVGRDGRNGARRSRLLEDQAVPGAVEQGSPLFQLAYPVGRLLEPWSWAIRQLLEQLPAADGVVEMNFPAVLGVDIPQCRSHSALGHDRVGLAQQRLAHQRGAQLLGAGLDGGPQPGAAGADDDDVEVAGFVLSHRSEAP